ncbi:MAG: hypothetical protein F082_1889, partial [bacterium F082]
NSPYFRRIVCAVAFGCKPYRLVSEDVVSSFKGILAGNYKGDKVTYYVAKNLETMYKKAEGRKVLDALSESRKTFNISNENPSSGDGGYVNEKILLGNRHGSLVILSHELFHAYQDLKGRNGRSMYNEVEAYIFQAIITGNTDGITSRNGNKKYNSTGKGLLKSFSAKDFDYILNSFRDEAVPNSRGTYCEERYKLNPRNLKVWKSLLKDL